MVFADGRAVWPIRSGDKMKLIEMTLKCDFVHIRYADHEDPAQAKSWIDFQVPSAGLELPNQPLGDPQTARVAAVRLAALRHVRDVIGDETQKIAALNDRSRQ